MSTETDEVVVVGDDMTLLAPATRSPPRPGEHRRDGDADGRQYNVNACEALAHRARRDQESPPLGAHSQRREAADKATAILNPAFDDVEGEEDEHLSHTIKNARDEMTSNQATASSDGRGVGMFHAGAEYCSAFWHKARPSHAPDFVESWRNADADPGETEVYAVLDNPAALAWAANFGAIELHPWTSTVEHPHRPTWAMVDIDPGTSSSFGDVVTLAQLHPRKGLARLDYTRNAINKTLVAPFSLRPRPGAPVSTPIPVGRARPSGAVTGSMEHREHR